MNKKPAPVGKCCAEDCNNDAKYWYDNSLFCHCGSIECVEKISLKVEKLKEDISIGNEAKTMTKDLR